MKLNRLFGLTAISAVLAVTAASATEIDYGYTGAAQFFTVPFTGQYQITAGGAQGGNAGGNVGGGGDKLGGIFDLTAGDLLELDVGGQGGYGYLGGSVATTATGVNISSFHYGAGGGGASWVRDNRFDLLLTAAGGGGAGALLPSEDTNPNLYPDGNKPDSPGSGGEGFYADSNGQGGAAGHNYNGTFGGGGGGTGFYTPGGSPAHGGGQGGGITPDIDGGFHDVLVGGLSAGLLAGTGGFGGGGGGDASGAGGGGGGFTGGEGGSVILASYITGYSSILGFDPEPQFGYETTGLGGKGGVSFFNGTSITPGGSSYDTQMGNGFIQIIYSDTQITGGGGGFSGPPMPGGVPEPATWAVMIIGIGMVGGMMRRRPRPALSAEVENI